MTATTNRARTRVVRGGRGPKGASTYQDWLKLNPGGSLEDFLASLVGPKGDPGGDAESTAFDDTAGHGVSNVQDALDLIFSRLAVPQGDFTYPANSGLGLVLGVY